MTDLAVRTGPIDATARAASAGSRRAVRNARRSQGPQAIPDEGASRTDAEPPSRIPRSDPMQFSKAVRLYVADDPGILREWVRQIEIAVRLLERHSTAAVIRDLSRPTLSA